jgi:hypothetical protein
MVIYQHENVVVNCLGVILIFCIKKNISFNLHIEIRKKLIPTINLLYSKITPLDIALFIDLLEFNKFKLHFDYIITV